MEHAEKPAVEIILHFQKFHGFRTVESIFPLNGAVFSFYCTAGDIQRPTLLSRSQVLSIRFQNAKAPGSRKAGDKNIILRTGAPGSPPGCRRPSAGASGRRRNHSPETDN